MRFSSTLVANDSYYPWFFLLPVVLTAGQEAGDGVCVSQEGASARFLRDQAWCLDGVDPQEKQNWLYWRITIFKQCSQKLIRNHAVEHRWMQQWEYFGEAPPPVSWRDNRGQ
jgi:hypothetical protein